MLPEEAHAILPPSLTKEGSATVEGAGRLQCQLGDVAGDESATEHALEAGCP